MTDVREGQVIFRDVESGEARGHVSEMQVGLACVHDRVVGAAIEELALLDDFGEGFFVGPHIPPSVFDRQSGQRAQGDAARARAVFRFTEAIGDQHRVGILFETRRQVSCGEAGDERLLQTAEAEGEIVIRVVRVQPSAQRDGGDLNGQVGGEGTKIGDVDRLRNNRSPACLCFISHEVSQQVLRTAA